MVAALAVAVLALPGSSSAGIDEVSLTVAPSTDLVEGDVVQIDAHDGGAPSSGVGICRSGTSYPSLVTALSRCSNLSALGGPDYSIAHEVARFVTMGAEPVDCVIEACSVFLYVGDGGFTTQSVLEVPLDLDADGPVVGVLPNNDLVHGAPVDVSFDGGEAGVATAVVQCVEIDPARAPDEAPNACEVMAATFGPPPVVHGSMWVQRWPEDGDGVIRDCAVVVCRIGVRHGNTAPYAFHTLETDVTATVVASFAPNLAFSADGHRIAAVFSNVDRSVAAKKLFQCVLAGMPGGTPVELGCVDIGATFDTAVSSNYSSAVFVERFVETDDGTYDCTPGIFIHPTHGYGSCAMVLKGYDAPSPDGATTDLSTTLFTLAVAPGLSVTPDDGLHATQTVEVRLEESSAHGGWAGVCPVVNDARTVDWAERACEGGAIGPWERGHTFEATVNRTIATTQLGSINCVDKFVLAVGGCEFVVLAGPDPQSPAPFNERVPLEFARSFAVPHVAPAHDGEVVPVQAEGWAGGPGYTAVPVQCGFLPPVSFENFFCRAAGPAEPDFDGDYDGVATVTRHIAAGDDQVDCASGPRCGVLLFVFDPAMNVVQNPGRPIVVVDAEP